MIVGNSLLTKIPWDVIVRWYRKQNDSSGFPKLEDYVLHFKSFVDSEILSVYIKKDVSFRENERTFLVFAGYGEEAISKHLSVRGYWNMQIETSMAALRFCHNFRRARKQHIDERTVRHYRCHRIGHTRRPYWCYPQKIPRSSLMTYWIRTCFTIP